ncbi:uncharacterized protein LOC116137545 [Pistacia vera]|uniref:uncharacterized protein LOC116137545 n=1 Tax=Pistacia vera TaxID=55513 RepID=UPI001263B5A9|nr:uncharacterized protein LOC116137545 [Pistacia vera]
MGGHVDNEMNQRGGPYVFKLCRQNYHQIRSLLPPEGRKPQFVQLYIHDTEYETSHRLNSIRGDTADATVDRELVQELQLMFDENNEFVKSFHSVRKHIHWNDIRAYRLCEGHTLLKSGRLLQQYTVDAYMAIEDEGFCWIRNNQKKLRSDLYNGLMDAISKVDVNAQHLGKSALPLRLTLAVSGIVFRIIKMQW